MIPQYFQQTKVRLKSMADSLVRETWLTSWELIRITIPVAIATKILEELGLIGYLSMVLEPVMAVIGLPGSLGLVWATAMLTNLYGGIAVFAALAPGLDLSGAQITVLCSAMLIAHSLPIELSVSKRAGASLVPIALIRLIGAVVYAYILNRVCLAFALWQDPAVLFFKATARSGALVQWTLDQVQNLSMIVFIIFCIVVFMRIFRVLGILDLLERILAPVLPIFGMGRQAAPLTVVGMIMGIGYGGALIIRETSTGKLDKEEVFNSMALMGLCHGLVEDTLIMAAIGGKFGGILWGRIVFSLIVTYVLVRVLRSLAERRIHRPA
ncbi:MAG: nucleoside recognition protein [uncultured bacterium]|nr:MAG: nucleoside recognition protein [uncultured bacterium]